MDIYVSYAPADADRAVDTDAPAESHALASAAVAHAGAVGAVVALCGAPLLEVTPRPWPSDADPACELCVRATGGFVS